MRFIPRRWFPGRRLVGTLVGNGLSLRRVRPEQGVLLSFRQGRCSQCGVDALVSGLLNLLRGCLDLTDDCLFSGDDLRCLLPVACLNHSCVQSYATLTL